VLRYEQVDLFVDEQCQVIPRLWFSGGVRVRYGGGAMIGRQRRCDVQLLMKQSQERGAGLDITAYIMSLVII